MRVFLSSTWEDLQEYRAKAANVIERLGQQGVRMEVFGARPAAAATASLEEIELSDAVVGIYAHRYGFVPPGSTVSITEQEFDYAWQRDKDLFCFFVDEDYPWRPAYVDSEPKSSLLRKFKSRVSDLVVRETFSTPDDLGSKVASSLGRFLLERSLKAELNRLPKKGAVPSQPVQNQVARRATRLKDIVSGARILLVNDVPDEMDGVINILNQLGIVVEVKMTSADGLNALTAAQFDAVISDMSRHGIDDEGLRFLKAMRERGIRHPTIFTVGRYQPELGTPAYAFGIANRVDELLNLLFDALERVRG